MVEVVVVSMSYVNVLAIERVPNLIPASIATVNSLVNSSLFDVVASEANSVVNLYVVLGLA